MVKNVDTDEKLTSQISNSGQIRHQLFLTEYGLYEVLMQSTKPIAKSFKKEINKILKELRIKGYLPAPADETITISRRALEILQLTKDVYAMHPSCFVILRDRFIALLQTDLVKLFEILSKRLSE